MLEKCDQGLPRSRPPLRGCRNIFRDTANWRSKKLNPVLFNKEIWILLNMQFFWFLPIHAHQQFYWFFVYLIFEYLILLVLIIRLSLFILLIQSIANEEKLLFYIQWVPMLYEFTKEQMKKDICVCINSSYFCSVFCRYPISHLSYWIKTAVFH